MFKKQLLTLLLVSNVLGQTAGSVEVQANEIDRTPIVISFAGDCTLGTYNGQGAGGRFDEVYNANGSAYFLENVKEIFENDTLTYVNLEGPLTSYKETAVKQFPIRGEKEYAQILVDGNVEVVSLNNNHILDCGENGLVDTKLTLDEYGIDYAINSEIAYQIVNNNVKVAFISLKAWSDSQEIRDLALNCVTDAKNNDADIIIVSYHWGEEGTHYSNAYQKSLGHYTVDIGADVVVGTHPHVLQGIEAYNGKTILYSLGNFCFGANKNPRDKDTIIYQQTFNVDENGTVTIGNGEVIPCKISSTSTKNDYKPTPCTLEDSVIIINNLKMYE